MTKPMIENDGFFFDRQEVNNLRDEIIEHIMDRYDGAFDIFASKAIGEKKEDETDDQYSERYMAAYDAATGVILNLFGSDDE